MGQTEIPFSRLTDCLSQEALRGLLEEFVTRDGTDYGETERSLDEKVAALVSRLERRDAVVIFDPESESFNIVPAAWLNEPTI